ncbi:PGRS family protein [Sorangium sp. So ce1504]|uniref:PGRS family protein n=1 Tax=Sorangium sp. So ce1504 TaxID=3133337 RepID=UPI003F62CF19
MKNARVMRWMRWGVAVAGVASGCDALSIGLTSDCDYMRTCSHFLNGDAGGTPEGCVPSESTSSSVSDTCGVFVSSSGDDENGATKDAPVKTVGKALALAEKSRTRRVYACAETFEEAVEVAGSVTIYGGLDCASGWAWAGDQRKTVLTARAGEIPLVVRSGGTEATVRVEDVHVQARGIDPEDVALVGASSIAAVAEDVSVELARCMLEAGDAAAGVDGALYEVSAMGGAMGNSGNTACSEDFVDPGASAKNDCGTPEDASDDSSGGLGGVGAAETGFSGTEGSPGETLNGGKGEGAAVCTEGAAGAEGAAGEAGAGAIGLGEISASGYAGVTGRDGARGSTAQGGGGGGGAKGGAGADKCPNEASAGGASGGSGGAGGCGGAGGRGGGASGGSGGAGGCGGAGGRGGGAGGASIALISLNAALSFEEVTLKTGRGGAGGKGGAGQEGGAGGAGGPGGTKPEEATALHDACAGGAGGKGGAGGPGGGGRGGHTLGIAYKGAAPPVEGATVELGDAGPGGAGANAEGEGAAGVKAEARAF